MERWRGKVALVTGASSGIGLATAKALVREGLTVVGLARRKEKMLNEMKNVEPGKFIARECDITKENDVEETFEFIKQTFKTVHILVNNAGIAKIKSIQDADLKEMQEVININLVGLVHCSKQAIKLMKQSDDGAHIININSVVGHKVPNFSLPNGVRIHSNVYSPTKFAVTSLSEVLRFELIGSKIRVTSLSPGYVKTEFIERSESKDPIEEQMNSAPYLNSEDVANAVLYVIATPHHVQVSELTIQGLGEVL